MYHDEQLFLLYKEIASSSRLKKVLLRSLVQELDREVGLHVAAKRLPKSSSWELRLSVDGSRR